MQSVSAAFTAEEKDVTRKIAQSTQISWHRQSTLGNRTFTIGVSTVGSNDLIGANPGAIGSPSNYRYFDESNYVTGLSWERGLNMPTGGLTMAMAEATLDNTSGRFTPRYMGGRSELFTAIIPNRPALISAGFNFGGVDQNIPQFAGVVHEQPRINIRTGEASLKMRDYVGYFSDKYLDQTLMFTSQRTDQVYTRLANQLGMSTAQYDFDYGINIPDFGIFDAGTKFSDIFHQLAEAENGHFYQDESGVFKFENRQHWDSSPYNQVQKVILTGQVIDAEAPSEDHLINVVEIHGSIYQKQPSSLVFSLPSTTSILVPANSSIDQFFEFQDPVLSLTEPTASGTVSYYVANSESDSGGTDLTSSISIRNLGLFSKSVKYRFTNGSGTNAYITQFSLSGRTAHKVSDLYYREQDDSSVTAYQEHKLVIDNPYIQNPDWAKTYANMILRDFSDVEKLQHITIRAIPELQIGDLVSWQGRYWRIYDIKTTLDTSSGFIQELSMLQRNITTYFRIGISSIGGSDRIAP